MIDARVHHSRGMTLAQLLEHEKVETATLDAVRARGAEVVPELIALFAQEELDWAPIHAVGLLVDLRAEEAIEPLLDVLVETSFDTIVHDRIVVRLPELGAAVLEPALKRAEAADDFEIVESLASILSELGVRDQRIRALIDEVFEEDIVLGAAMYADYGDPSAVEVIDETILDYEPDLERTLWLRDLTELMAARRELGGEPSEEIVEKVDALKLAWRRHIGATGRVGSRKIGRNDPCPCQSGKKFKKCCAQLQQT